MSELVEDLLVIQFDNAQELLVFYDIDSDGEKHMITHVPLSKLIEDGKDTASDYIGQIVLSCLKSIREAYTKAHPETQFDNS